MKQSKNQRSEGKQGNRSKPGGSPPPSYVCFRCNLGGHYINQCPGIKDKDGNKVDPSKHKRPTGIPRSFLVEVSKDTPGAYLTKDGQYALPVKDRDARFHGQGDMIDGENPVSTNSKHENGDDSDLDALLGPLVSGCTDLILDPRDTPSWSNSVRTEASLIPPLMDFPPPLPSPPMSPYLNYNAISSYCAQYQASAVRGVATGPVYGYNGFSGYNFMPPAVVPEPPLLSEEEFNRLKRDALAETSMCSQPKFESRSISQSRRRQSRSHSRSRRRSRSPRRRRSSRDRRGRRSCERRSSPCDRGHERRRRRECFTHRRSHAGSRGHRKSSECSSRYSDPLVQSSTAFARR